MMSLDIREEIEDEWWEAPERDHCGNVFVVHESSRCRSLWNLLISLLLAYTATIFLYRICFIEFNINRDQGENGSDSTSGWETFEVVVNSVFWVDLFANFFFSYRDPLGHEVDSLRLIGRHYLAGYFAVNLIACVPEEVVQALVMALTAGNLDRDFTGNQALRVWRLQRVSRLARLARLMRLAKLASFKPSNRIWLWIQGLRGVRILNNAVGLIWVAHLLACGWYLCAALHEDARDTWVYRRDVYGHSPVLDMQPLLEQDAFEQWVHSFYFVLTVFTTVGFGDISATTTGEIIYVCFTMVVGTVVHSIIISEVISIVTKVDDAELYRDKQSELVEAFADHTELGAEQRKMMTDWVTWNAKSWVTSRYDREEMKHLITGKCIPRWILGQLPANLFGGRLLQNQFLTFRFGLCEMPPRLPLLLAMAFSRTHFEAGEIVYQVHDFPFNLFLVLDGIFANVARPTRQGGVDENDNCDMIMDEQVSDDTAAVEVQVQGTQSMAMWFQPSMRKLTENMAVEPCKSEHPRTSTRLYPYRLYGRNNYFGDFGLLESCPRRATVRCESDNGGSTLVLHKNDFHRIAEEFPQFAAGWRHEARRREGLRCRQLARLSCGMTIRHLAATRIQQWMRVRQQWQRPPTYTSLPWVSSGDMSALSPRSDAQGAAARRTAAEAAIAAAAATTASAAAGAPAAVANVRGAGEGHATKGQVVNLSHGMDALRSDFALLRRELRTAVSALVQKDAMHRTKASHGDPSWAPAMQSAAYPTGAA